MFRTKLTSDESFNMNIFRKCGTEQLAVASLDSHGIIRVTFYIGHGNLKANITLSVVNKISKKLLMFDFLFAYLSCGCWWERRFVIPVDLVVCTSSIGIDRSAPDDR